MLRTLSTLRHPWAALVTLLVLLSLRYVHLYFAEGALPGNNPLHPEGWWGWWDQSQYIASARALATGDFSAARHWYPMGYALLGAPFAQRWPTHPFFLVNLVSLLVTAWAFLGFARRVGVRAWIAALLFLGSVAWDGVLMKQWAIPWNTSPTTAVLWVLLRLAADHMAGQRRAVLLGMGVSLAGLLRPTDLLPAFLILGAVGLHEVLAPRGAGGRLPSRGEEPTGKDWAKAWGTVWRVAAGGLAVAAAGLALHVSIYGLAPSPYMLNSTRLGFSFHAFGWKAFNLLVAPQPWWGAGEGLISRHPWIGLTFIMLPFALRRGPAVGMLALASLAHLALYIAYVDLLPTGFWLFHNVHYTKWILPGFALIAWLGVVEALSGRRGWRVPATASAVILLVLCVRIVPEAAGEGVAWRGIYIPGPRPPMEQSYFKEDARLSDARGTLVNIADYRLWPVDGGVVLMALRRDLVPPVQDLPEGARPVVARAVLAWPCWLGRPRACGRGPL